MTRQRAALALLLLAAAGCYTIRYERRAAAEPGPALELTHHGFLGGTIRSTDRIDLAAQCPNGIVSVENETTFPQALIQGLTMVGPVLGFFHAPIWEPTMVRVVCARDGLGAGGKERKIALMRLAPLGDVDAKTVALFSEALAGELRKRPGISVISDSDIAALLGVEKTKAMLGCTDAGCIAEVGGALGADRVVHGSVGRVGNSLLVNLSSLDSKRATTAASVSERLKGAADEAFLDALPRIVDELLAEPKR